jgi:hypothetical protein
VKPISELESMDYDNLLQYINIMQPTKEALFAILEEVEVPYRTYDSKIKVYQHFARQISGIGLYKRIAKEK